MNRLFSLLACSLSASLATSASATVAMDYVRVGNPNNAPDTTSYGAVDHAYWIGKYEVTNAQYAEFLNAKGQSNDNGIYNSSMASYGITQSGSSGSYSYTVTSALANRPVVFVSWFDAARFANWMMNGQGNASMETGAYTLNGATSGIILANAGAKVYIPSENEWYKAAYNNATSQSYSLYPNGQNTISTADANYGGSAYTAVGTYSGDPSSYGTFDQGGNVWEWNDAVIGSSREFRGGGFDGYDFDLRSSSRPPAGPTYEGPTVGFRVAAASIDTDSDGIDDLAETNTGIYISPSNTGTNPSSADTDADGVPDGLEVKEKTSPVDATKFNAFSKGMVAYYPLDKSGADETGSGYNGNFSNSSLEIVDGIKTLKAIGSSPSGLLIPNGGQLALPATGWAISGWIKCNDFSAAPYPHEYFTLFETGGVSGIQGSAVYLSYSAHGLNFQITGFDDSPINAAYLHQKFYRTNDGTSDTLSAGQWHHIMVIVSGSEISAFVDGSQLIGSSRGGSTWSGEAPKLTARGAGIGIGTNNHGGSTPNNSYIKDVRIYGRSLGLSEVAALYSSEAPPKPHFQIIQGSYTWHQAKADAEARGGRLAVLNTQAKIDHSVFLTNNPILQGGYHIGLQDPSLTGQWKWINGSNLSASNWASGEPQNYQGRGETVVAMIPTYGGSWADIRNDDIYDGYILEFPNQILTVTLPTHGSITGAGEYDSGTSATLTAIPDAGYAFTGWTGDASGTTNPLSLTMDADKTVGATFAADLSDVDADGLTAYDEVTIYHTDPTKADSDNDGLTDAYELGIGRFSVVAGTRTWAQAKTDAETQGGTLATFASQEEYNLAMQSIGSDALLDVGGLWIGATDEVVEGTWTWVTGEPFVFTLWETGQPDNSNNSDYAAVAGDLGGTSGKWYDYRATTSRDGYILESGYSTNPSDADSDDDGLLDGAERTAGSNPFNADTDGDTLTDAEEVNLTLTNPTLADSNSNGTNDAADDQDGDGVTNLAEIRTHGTNPVLADTDGDGISDGAELAMTQNFYKLVAGSFNQAQAAADAATKRGRLASLVELATYTSVVGKARRTSQGYLWVGLSDAAAEGTWKWADGTTLNFNRWLSGQPDGGSSENFALIMENASTLADGAAAFVAAGYLYERTGLDPLIPDTDGDGLNDGAEQNTHSTNPFNDDSDNDGLLDGPEVLTHFSNPNKADTDDDGLTDKQEVETYLTNPAAKDSDSDGFDDLFEINTGFNPLLASSTPDAVSTIRTSVEFRFNAANGVSYRIEASTDLSNWASVEDIIIGTGGVVTRFYSIENQPKRYFRVRRN